jgi:pimeloyl-ACP methyl ester carboxylesterase
VAGGRQLEVLVAGPAEGRVLLLHSGTPSGLVEPEHVTATAAARGVRTVICARPGYSGSAPQPGRRVVDAAADAAAVLDALGVGEFVTAGWSGGGPHALACAAKLPGRCRAAGIIAGVAPYQAPGLDWLAGMGPENITEFGAAAEGPDQLEGFLGEAAGELAEISGAQIVEGFGGLIGEADKAVLTGEFAGYLAAAMRAAVSQGLAGWRDDDLAFVADWGFTPAEAAAAAPVTVWQGGQDRMVPLAHGTWLTEHLPGARPHLLAGEGHLSIVVHHFGAILDELLELAGWATAEAGTA